MNHDDPNRDDILEQNLARLIERAYVPETPDPAFAARVEDRLLAASRPGSGARGPSLVSRLFASTAAAALLAGVLALGARDSDPVHRHVADTGRHVDTSTATQERADLRDAAFSGVGGTPLARPEAPDLPRPSVGTTIRMDAQARRLVRLPDGTRLYLDGGAEVEITGERSLRLDAGRVFLEVHHDPANPYRITTPDRAVEALGTRFALDAHGTGTEVLVTQGRVKVDGVASVLTSGQRLPAGDARVVAADRIPQTLAWTRDLMAAAQSPLVPKSADRGGALVAVDPWGQEMRLGLRKMHVDVHIEDGFARTTIDQTYFNHTRRRLEGTFRFPLPADASLSRLAMYVAGVRMEGGMTERRRGRDVYETIVNRRLDPALLEWIDGSTFKMRVFPLEAREEKRIVLSYTQRLAPEHGRRTYRFPAGHDLIAIGDWSFRAHVADGAATRWSSPSHALASAVNEEHLDLECFRTNYRGDEDVVLTLDDTDRLAPDSARFVTHEHEGHRYLMVRYRPEFDATPERRRRDWVVTFERSGERDPVVARAQIEVLREWLAQAEPDDTFSILALHTGVHTLTPEPLPATAGNIDAALAHLERIHLIGGLDLGAGLAAATERAKELRDPVILHLGSGVASLGERDPGDLARRLDADTPFVGIAVGRRWSRPFLAAAAARTGGLVAQVHPDEALRFRALELHARFATPRLLSSRVVDEAESAAFLAFEDAVAGGQELAAVTRIEAGQDLPASVVVSGVLDGAAFSRTLQVENVTDGAGYLPRQWARLELERMTREDAQGHREAIVDLSKKSYVMSPFTSLLVLETPEMYKQFNVDTGRTDHWARYDCPDKIEVVREPLDGQTIVDADGNARKPSAAEILQTILVRDRRPILQSPYGWRGYYGTQTVAQAIQTMQANPHGFSDWSFTETDGIVDVRLTTATFGGRMTFTRSGVPRVEATRQIADAPWFVRDEIGLRGGQGPGANGGLIRSSGERFDEVDALDKFVEMRQWGQGGSFSGPMIMNGFFGMGGGAGGGFRAQTLASSGPRPIDMAFAMNEIAFPGPAGEVPPDLPMSATTASREISSWGRFSGSRHYYGYGYGWGSSPLDQRIQMFVNRLNYNRPNANTDLELWSDLLGFAPAMNTTSSDIAGVLAEEARPSALDRPGRIDDGAARLFAAARERGWRRVRIPVRQGEDYDVVFAGDGRLAYERTLSSGLREVVVNDGGTLLHLYPELGVGARRRMSRFHRAVLARLLPFVVPPAADLAHGADLVAVDERSVDVVPHVPEGEDGPWAGPVVRYVFGESGDLAEIAWRRTPDGATAGRTRFEADRIVWFDAKGEELDAQALEITEAAGAPNLAPDTNALIVLPLPYRTYTHVQKAFDIQNPNDPGSWSDEAALAVAGAHMGQNQHGLLQVLGRRYLFRDDHRPGVYTLLLASGYSVKPGSTTRLNGNLEVEIDPLLAGRTNPLAVYLDAQMRRRTGNHQDLLPRLPGPRDTFLAELAEYGSIVTAWNSGHANQQGEQRTALIRRTFEFAESAHWSRVGWGVLNFLWNYGVGNDAAYRERLAAAAQRFEDEPGLRYPTRYESARALQSLGKNERARERFRELFVEALDAGHIPPIDWSFVQAMNHRDGRNDGDADGYARLLEEQSRRLTDRGSPTAAVWLALQAHRVGQAPAGDAVFARIVAEAEPDDQDVQLTAVQYLRHAGRPHQARAWLARLLESKPYSEVSAYWRLQAILCQQMNDLHGTTRALERLFDLELERMPDVVNLQQVRADHQWLFGFYRQVASGARAARADDGALDTAFLARVVRAADRWRALEPDDTLPCTTAAQVMLAAGADGLAWDYLTTPLAQRPNEPGPWTQLAVQLLSNGDLANAERAYANAYEVETSNPQHLWDRAGLLLQLGEREKAEALYDRIVDGEWQPRFQAVQRRARAIRGR